MLFSFLRLARRTLSLALVAGATAQAQSPVVVGIVRDSSGVPLPNVEVLVNRLNRSTHSSSAGRFEFRGLPAGQYHFTSLRIGFAPGHADVTVPTTGDSVRVELVMRPTALQLAGVQVTATPVGTDPRDVTQSAAVLEAQALARTAGATIAQTLEREPGIAVRFSGPGTSAPVIRGLQGERVLVLRDGDRAGDLSSSSPDHGISVDPLIAQRIEVVRGPASLLYGNSALGGVVNVISSDVPTTIPSHIDGYVASQMESATSGVSGAAGLTVPLTSRLAVVLRGGARSAQDYRQGGGSALDNTQLRNAYGTIGLAGSGTRAHGGAVFRTYGFRYGLPSAEGEGIELEGRRNEVVGHAEMALAKGPLQSVRLAGTSQWYNHDELGPDGEIHTSFDLKTQSADLIAQTQMGSVRGAFGVSGLGKQYASTGDEALTPAANSVGIGAYIFEDVPLRRTDDADARVPRLQVGGRVDSYRISSSDSPQPRFGPGVERTFSTFSGSVGVSMPITGTFSAAINAARAFRAPSVEELFSNGFHEAAGTFDRGNGTLDAEINNGIEGLVRFHDNRLSAQISAFASSIQNYISPDIVKDTLIDGESGPETVPLNAFTQGDARMRGFEAQVEYELTRRLVVGAMADLVRGTFVTTDEPLPFMPPARVGSSVRWSNGRWSAGGEVRHGFAQSRVPTAINDDDPSGFPTDAWTTANLTFGLLLPLADRVHSFTFRVDNVGDVSFRDATSRIKTFALNPGRNASLVYRVTF